MKAEPMISIRASLTLAACLLGATASAQSFSYTDFSSIAGLALNEDAIQAGTTLRLTSAVISERGSAWYDQTVAVGGGFDTTFDFQMTQPSGGGADGMAFVIQFDPRGPLAIGNHASAMGYAAFNAPPTGIAIENSIAIEIDTFFGSNFLDLSGNEISIHTNGQGENDQHENASIGSVSPSINMSDGQVHTMRILYVPGQIDVFLDDLVNPVLTAPYDFGTGGTWMNSGTPVGGLALDTGGTAWVGFTASNGGSWETHDVLSWDWMSGAALFTPFCTSATNSTGGAAMISASGSSSIAANDLQLVASPVPTGEPGIFYYGPDEVGGIPFGEGFRCVGGPAGTVKRLFPFAIGDGSNTMTLAVNNTAAAHAPQLGVAGSTWKFQAWFRDPQGGPSGFNLSNGLSVDFVP